MTTSDSAYEKTDLENMETTEKEDGDLEGPFPLGVSITEELSDDKRHRLFIFHPVRFFSDQMNATVSEQTMSCFLHHFHGCAEQRKITVSLFQANLLI